MLVNFKFSNFKSFKDEAEFSMEPLTNNGSISNAIETGYKKAPCVYRTSAIFGANASGKSNFIEAMLALKFLITKSYRNSTDSNIYGLEYIIFDFEAEESAGTKTLLDLSKDLIEVLKGGRILFADELDKSLHPHLVKYLVNILSHF